MRNATRRAGVAAAAAAAVVLAVGCGSTAPHAHGPAAPTSVPASSLDTSLATPAGTWATVVMGGSAASNNNFWQLFIRPAGAAYWHLVTPPGTADNGGLILAAGGGEPVVSAFRPSRYLTYTPLTQTRDGGLAWSALNPLDAALASTPDALAMKATGGSVLALLTDGTAEAAAGGSAAWQTIATERTLAATSAGRRCGLQAVTAAAYTPSGVPVLAGTCARPGTVGIFAGISRGWQPAGPALPAALASQQIKTLRLTTTGSQVVALLEAGSGHAASLIAAWSRDNGAHWSLSAPLPLGGAAMTSASFGAAGTAAVIPASGRAEVITGGGTTWTALPALPAGTATLAPGTGGEISALAAQRSTLTIWQLLPGHISWTKTQVISVPIQYGSSG